MAIDMEKARKTLLEEKVRLEFDRERLNMGESSNEEMGELTDFDANHPADAGTEMFEKERDLALVDSLNGQLIQIETALSRVDAGTYGTCERCGKPIGAERLIALPSATYCITCAEEVESSE